MTDNAIVREDLEDICAPGIAYEELSGRTVLISGANGFLPAYLVETLLHLNETRGLGIRVIGLVRDRARAESRFRARLGRADLRLIVQDVSLPLEISGPIDYVVHAASQASPKYFGKDPVGTLLPNVLGTYRLLDLARTKKSLAFLFFSSGEVYGEVDASTHLIKETDRGSVDPLKVRSCYAESKRMGETMCVSWAHQHGVPAKIARPFHTYGPGMALDDGRGFSDLVADVVHRRNLALNSDGSAIRSYCYLADATRAFFSILLHGAVGEAYNVGNDRAEISVLDLARVLAGLFPDRNLRIAKKNEEPGYLKSEISRHCPDIAKIRALGWSPKRAIEDGFKRTVLFYEDREAR